MVSGIWRGLHGSNFGLIDYRRFKKQSINIIQTDHIVSTYNIRRHEPASFTLAQVHRRRERRAPGGNV